MRDFNIEDLLKRAIIEDLGQGDLFARCISRDLANKQVEARIIAKEGGIFSGELYLGALYKMFAIQADFTRKDGESFAQGEVLATLKGRYIDILQTERVGLNILAHSSGIATNTHSFVRILRENGFSTMILDTRKTRPFLRDLEKYSTRNGGAQNHRFGLFDCVMLKDTNLAKLGDLGEFIKRAKSKIPFTAQIEVECESLKGARIAMESGANIVMCDNMSVESIAQVVAVRNAEFPSIKLEASGNITRENIAQYAKSGVDALSIGALIHQAKWLDLSLKMCDLAR